MKKTLHFFCWLLVFISPLTISAQNFDSVVIKTTKLSSTTYMLEGAGGNIGVLAGKDGFILVDDQYAPLTEKIRNALKTIGDNQVRFVINTHFHLDHVGGNENLGGTGTVIVAHENSRRRMSTDQMIDVFKLEQKATAYIGLPKVTFTESVTFHMNGETVQVYHVKNAHTDGDAIIQFKESNVIHGGDVFFTIGLPFIDQPNGGSIDGMISAVDKMLALANDESQIIPGHGPLGGKKELQEYRDMLKKVRDKVANAIKAGKTLDQVISMDPAREYKSFLDRAVFVSAVYNSLKK